MNSKDNAYKPYLNCYYKSIKMEHVALLYVIQDRQEDRLSIIDYNREYFRKSSNVTVGNWISHCEDLKLIVVILDPLNRRVKIPKLTVKGAKLLQTLT